MSTAVLLAALKPKNSILSIKGILLIACAVVGLAGAITIWAVLDGANSTLSYWSGLMVLIPIFNLVAYIFGLPLIFAWTAVLFWVVGPQCVLTLDGVRRTSPKNNDLRAVMAGGIIEIIAAAASFFGVPSDGFNYSSIIDLIALGVVAVFDIVGGAILANINQHIFSTQVFICLCLFAIAIVFGSRGLMYATLAVNTILFATLLNGAFGGDSKSKAAFSISWIGVTITTIYAIICIAIFRLEPDKFGDTVVDTVKSAV